MVTRSRAVELSPSAAELGVLEGGAGEDRLAGDELVEERVDSDEIAGADVEVDEGAPADTEEDEAEREGEADEHEASLDELFALHFAPRAEDGAEDEPGGGTAVSFEPGEMVAPVRADEFVCRSCFLIRHRRQLGDPARHVCRDCL